MILAWALSSARDSQSGAAGGGGRSRPGLQRGRGGDDVGVSADFGNKSDTWIPSPGEGRPPLGPALLVITRGPHAGSQLVLDRPVTSAGRHPDSDIFLDDVTVSRRHAEFRVTDDNDVQVVDVGSLNGTYVNREPVDSATLTHGDEVQLGKFRLRFLTGEPPSAT